LVVVEGNSEVVEEREDARGYEREHRLHLNRAHRLHFHVDTCLPSVAQGLLSQRSA
jgi:hypothetical protein